MVPTPTTARVLPIPYALPPFIILTALISPLALKVILPVACLPVTDAPIETNLAL